MIETVFTFAFVSALFELVVLMKMKPRTRLRILGSKRAVTLLHVMVIAFNITVHYGTVTGSLTAVTAGLVSFVCVPIARWLSGYIRGRTYVRGMISYRIEDLK